jgi:hypothetical protein
MNVYNLIFLLLFIFAVLEILKINFLKINKKIILILLICFAGLRLDIETDYDNYNLIFKNTENILNIEIGYFFLNNCIKIFTKNFNVFIFIIAAISIFMKHQYIKKQKNYFNGMMIYYLYFYLMLEFNVIRQGIALGILLFALSYLEKKNWKIFSILVGIATLFHISSIIFFVFYPFYITKDKVFKLWKIFLSFGIGLGISYFNLINKIALKIVEGMIGIKIISDEILMRAKIYLIHENNGNFITIGGCRRVVLLMILIFLLKETKNIKLKKYIKLYYYGCLIFFIFSRNIVISNRIGLIFDVMLIPIFSNLFYYYKPKIKILKLIIFCISILLGYGVISTTLINGKFLPYKTYINF